MSYNFIVYNRFGDFIGVLEHNNNDPVSALQEMKKRPHHANQYPMVEPYTPEAWAKRHNQRIEFLPMPKGEKQ